MESVHNYDENKDKLIEKYSQKCVTKENVEIQSKECDDMLLVLQRLMLPKSKNSKCLKNK